MTVSYIIVTNRPEFAEIVLQQYQMQDYPEKELVVVEAAETDGILKDHADTYVRVNVGATVGAMRNIGAAAAKGDWIFWLDDDDWRSPDLVSYLVEHSDGFDVVGLGWVTWVDLDGGVMVRGNAGWPIFAAAIYRNKDIPRFRPQTPRKTDSYWLLRMRDAGRQWSVLHSMERKYAIVCHGRNVHNPRLPDGNRAEATIGMIAHAEQIKAAL